MNQTPSTHKLIHTRHVTCNAYLRDDGLIDIVGEMRDISPDGTNMLFKRVAAGGRIHYMRVVMTIGTDMLIRAVEARTLDAPTQHCPEIESAYAALAGLEVGPGFTAGIKARVGGVKGCTHLTELLGPMATTAFQACYALQRSDPQWWKSLEGDAPMPQPRVVGTCHTYRTEGEATRVIWPVHRRKAG